jgi:diacylglycerol kinase (ATP)
MKKTKWYLVVNPIAGNGKGKKYWPSIQALLKKTGVEYEFGITEHEQHAIELAKNAVLAGYKYIGAVGGDGTVNEVINGMCDQGKIPTNELTFAIIPIGTGNDWIRTHKIPINYKKAILLISKGKTKPHDVGKVFYHTADGIQEHRHFVNVAGLAYDAFVTKATKVRPKWGNSQLYYLYLILSCVTQFKPTPVKVIFDGEEMEHPFFNITIGQCIYNGGGTMLLPHANPNDGLFALTMFKNIKPWEVVFKSHKFYNGSIIKHKEAFTTQAKHIRIEAPHKTPAFIEVDGEYLGQTPIDIEMLAAAINIIVP